MSNNYYEINLPLFRLGDDNKIIVPDETDSIWFDVGLSFSAPNSVQFLNRAPNGFVIGFEPDPRMYFALFAANKFAESLWLLDSSHPTASIEMEKRRSRAALSSIFKEKSEEYLSEEDILRRFILVPGAISDKKGTTLLHLNAHHGSSSLSSLPRGGDPRVRTVGEHLVSTFRLDEFIRMIPDRFEYLDHLKVDAEGVDDAVVLSAGSLISRFVVVTTEMRMDSLMNGLGFEFLKTQPGAVSYLNRAKKELLPRVDCEIRV